ncbi:vitamin-D-receptor interacting mediator subunit 4-domain-containing protein [Microdochium trichocladiopsis]|uniref:Mediator of RNA polymerase II transcription subunit 4 n=1 Tax=Microdochium trichocladiopsis TaxID=1682393 RepID=A0A9P8Y7D2_9PEZI|nr:vitamin-D-receptor interacting mediator subunit 4-domain-containing protein [Microdochium trichocladiopsis]KAH7031676.1 vitamin-D-receptor interacting mediator subunit 4-domain-containing protein [Microdochium trichocladiopsis]
MDKQIDARFDRVERALGSLTDSIAKYNPSIAQAHDYIAADEELHKGLEELQIHQTNHYRLEQLRAATASLDTQIKDTLRLLANTRKELSNAPATVFPDGPHYDIQYDQLLNYARIISRTTIPPAAAVAALQAQTDLQTNVDVSGLETAATTPGIVGTPAATPNGVQSVPGGATPAPAQAAHPMDPAAQGSAADAERHLPGHIVDHIRSTVQTQFVPWPNEDNVRHGSLASMAILMEKGIDPENYDPEAEKLRKEREEQERREAEERERVEREERERRLREEQARQRAELARQREKENAEGWRRQSVSAGGNPPASSPVGEKKQFMFTSLDDDDDDDD